MDSWKTVVARTEALAERLLVQQRVSALLGKVAANGNITILSPSQQDCAAAGLLLGMSSTGYDD